MSVYAINKGVNRPIVFKGLKGQYIGWLGIGLLGLLLAFALLYLVGIPMLVCIVVVLFFGGMLFSTVYQYSSKYGENGLTKKLAGRYIPTVIKCDERFK